MIIIDLPMLGLKPTIYTGEKEYKSWVKIVTSWMGIPPSDRDKMDDGSTVLWFAWVEDKDNLNAIFHELSHVIDNLIDYTGINDKEFKACLTAYLFEQALYNKRLGV